jgi:hypothetical protein
MTINPITGISTPPSHVLGLKLDSIPFSAYHVVIILVLGFVGFIEGYDLALTGSLLVLAKGPLHMDADAVRALATWPTFLVVIGGFAAAGMSDPDQPRGGDAGRCHSQHLVHAFDSGRA